MKNNQVCGRTLTRLLVWITAAILSLCSPFCSRDRWRHSIGRIFWYSWLSMMVSCLANSSGSTSSNLSFLDVLGMIGGGGVCNVAVILIASVPLCYNSVPEWEATGEKLDIPLAQ